MRQQMPDPAAIEAEIARVRLLSRVALWRLWRTVFGRTPPRDLSKDLLARMITRQIQKQAFGGLDRDSLTFLDGLARQGGPRRRQLKLGTVLVREYQGQRHIVTVTRDGFDWQGRTYPSLSAIARVITGTAWSGPRFFALQVGSGGAKLKTRSAASRRPGRHHHRPTVAREGTNPAAHDSTQPTIKSPPLQWVNLKP